MEAYQEHKQGPEGHCPQDAHNVLQRACLCLACGGDANEVCQAAGSTVLRCAMLRYAVLCHVVISMCSRGMGHGTAVRRALTLKKGARHARRVVHTT